MNDVILERIEIIKNDYVREKRLSLKILLSVKSIVSIGILLGFLDPLSKLKYPRVGN